MHIDSGFLLRIAEIIIPAIFAWLIKSPLTKGLPSWASVWFGRVSENDIKGVILEAEKLEGYTSEQRRAYVAQWITDMVWKNWALKIPTSVTNLLVEYVYQRMKR
jgi:hypothetical protein